MISLFIWLEEENILRGFRHQNCQNKRIILFQHGYFSANCSGPNRMFFEIAEIGLKNDYDSLRVDMIGTGISDGELKDSDYSDNLRAYQNILENLRESYDEIVLVGHSMGTSYTLELSHHPKVKLSILISPSFGKIDKIDSLLNKKQLHELANVGFTDRKGLIISKRYLDQSQNVALKSYKKSIVKPLVFIYGSEDEMYTINSLSSFIESWEKSKDYKIPKADHNFIEIGPRAELLKIIGNCIK